MSKVHHPRPMESDKCGPGKAGRPVCHQRLCGPRGVATLHPGGCGWLLYPNSPLPLETEVCLHGEVQRVCPCCSQDARQESRHTFNLHSEDNGPCELSRTHFCLRPLHHPLRPSSALLCGSCMCARMTLRSSSIRRRSSELLKRGAQRDWSKKDRNPRSPSWLARPCARSKSDLWCLPRNRGALMRRCAELSAQGATRASPGS